MQRQFRILDVGLSLGGPESVLAPIFAAYRRFASATAPRDVAARLEIVLEEEAIRVDRRRIPLVPDLDPALQLYQVLVSALMDAIDTHLVLHAAALVDRRGRAALLAAPSGHGKSSLTLELARRGLGFLSDDFAPLDTATRCIAPYPRSVGLIDAGGAPIPEVFRARLGAADADQRVRLFGKTLLDIGEVLGESALAQRPAPLGHVFLLAASSEPTGGARSWLHVAARLEDAATLEQTLRATPGVTIEQWRDQSGLRFWSLCLDHAQGPTAALAPVLDGDRIVYCEKHWEARPDFSALPQALPIKRREAAEHLGRELLNRRGGGRLLARYAGGPTELFLDLAGTLRETRCFRVRVGDYRRTADLIEGLIDEV